MRKYLLTIAAVTALAGGCSRVDERSASSGSGSPAGATPALGVRTTATGAPALSPPRRRGAFASLPDRGVLLAIDTRQAPRRTRAYTFHPVQVSEEHALRAIATGTMAIPTPDGSVLRLRYERHYEHPDGNWTWVGRPDGAAPGTEAILTFGEKAVFGTIPDGDRPPFLLSMIDGRAWMVRTDVKGLASLDAEATRPTRPDHLLPPRLLGGGAEQGAPRSAGETRVAAGAGAVANAAPASMTVDVVLGYTTGFATRLGGQSQANTRLAHIVAVTNEAYNNSQIDAAVRLVRTVQVDYPDATKNQDALYDLSGVSCTEQSNGSLSCTSKPVPVSLQPLLAARDQYGGDLVSLVRNFNRPENEGCGIAWLIGGGQDPISTADAGAGISIVSDSNLNQFPDDGYICRDETLAHELGHNMGSQHDRAEADGNDNVLQANEYGRYPYSFGYKTSSGSGNFYTIMAYGDSGQRLYRVFSNPNITACGNFACGIPDQADNARSLRQTIPMIATFRATVVPPTPAVSTRTDINGDRRSDIFWRNQNAQMADWWLMNGTSWSYGEGKWVPGKYRVAGRGDFDGDGRSDVLWEDGTELWIWRSEAAGGFSIHFLSRYPTGWTVAGIDDLNGDGRDDIFWSNRSAQMADWWLMNGTSWSYGGGKPVLSRYRVAGVGDFDGDGRNDVLWEDGTELWIWRSEAAGGFSIRFLSGYPAGWSVAGIADLNGDGRDDIFWSNRSAQMADWWLMNGTSWIYGGGKFVPAQYWVVGPGDFDGDGRSDVLWTDGSTLWTWRSEPVGGFSVQYLGAHPGGWTPHM